MGVAFIVLAAGTADPAARGAGGALDDAGWIAFPTGAGVPELSPTRAGADGRATGGVAAASEGGGVDRGAGALATAGSACGAAAR